MAIELDAYQILGVSYESTAEDIKAAYRQLANKHHPDKAGGNAGLFSEINRAYEAIGGKRAREKYDARPSYDRLTELFSSVIDNHELDADIIVLCRAKVARVSHELTAKINKLDFMSAKLSRQVGRVSSNVGFNVFESLLSDKIDKTQSELRRLRRELSDIEAAGNLLDNYTDEGEPQDLAIERGIYEW